MILYNLFPLLAGTFPQWEPHLQRAGRMGCDWVFINPIQQPGKSGSLYSIADYFQLNPRLVDSSRQIAGEDQVREMTGQARAGDMKLMIDLVINHCAIDSPLTREHPEWFLKEKGKIANPFAMADGKKVVWKDLAQFDYLKTRDPEGLYQFCLSVVNHLLGLGFEGFRCDAAYQIPPAFWQRLIREIKTQRPQTCFIAETLGCTTEQTRETARAGFDFVFNSSKYWNFNDAWLIEQYNLIRETARSISFPESHDTQRLAEEVNGNVEALKQRYLFAALFSAGVMFPVGFEYGFRKRLHVVQTRPSDWETTGIDLVSYIGKVNAIKQQHSIFQEECPTTILPYKNPNILLMWKASQQHRQEALLILNKDVRQHQEFSTENMSQFVQAGGPLQDVSPEYPLDFIAQPFHYALRPGQGIVLVSRI